MSLADALAGFAALSTCLYVIRDGEVVFYIGITTQLLEERLKQHCGLDYGTPSQLGRLVAENAPESLAWQVDAYEPSDLPGNPSSHDQIEYVERYFILTMKPCLNASGNPSPSPLPKRYQRYDRRQMQMNAIRRAFGETKSSD